MEIDVLVNKDNSINPLNYIPSNLVVINDEIKRQLLASFPIVSEAIREPFQLMKVDFDNYFNRFGTKIIIDDSYRSYEKQKEIFEIIVAKKGFDYANKYVAKAGYSEHQTGLAVDVALIKNNVYTDELSFDDEEVKWLIANSYRYGFILRYPISCEKITGIFPEPWHYRYVGKEIAYCMHNEKIKTLEEYHFLKKKKVLVKNFR